MFFNMKKIFWLSRHPLTNGQVATLQAAGFDQTEQRNVLFNDSIIEQVEEITNSKVIALVAPLNYGLTLLRAGYTLIEFQNVPSARQKGVFLCKGMNIHTLAESSFVSCPLSIEEQESGSLAYEAR